MLGFAVEHAEPVAIVHDWLTSMRGGERVVEALCRVFPQADLFTLTWDPAAPLAGAGPAGGDDVGDPQPGARALREGPFPRALAAFPAGRGVLQAEPLLARGVQQPLRGHRRDRAAHGAARGLRPLDAPLRARGAARLRGYRPRRPAGPRGISRGRAHYLRRWETRAGGATPPAHRQQHVHAEPHPSLLPTATRWSSSRPSRRGRFELAASRLPAPDAGTDAQAPFLLVSALVPYKRVDLALRAFQGRPERLVVVGEGPERARLERLLGPNTTLLPRVDESELASLFAGCRALVHTGVDDFGMVMVEALAAGKPVIACAEGGASTSVAKGRRAAHRGADGGVGARGAGPIRPPERAVRPRGAAHLRRALRPVELRAAASARPSRPRDDNAAT